jgi:hypothetical protein
MGLSTYLRKLRFRTDLPYRIYDRLTLLLGQFGPRYPLRRVTDDARPSPFFIVGSGRSGNTLLRAILTGNPELAIPPESYVLGPAVRDYRRLGFLPWRMLARVVLGRFQFHPQFETWQTDVPEVYRAVAGCSVEYRSLAKIVDELYRAYARRHQPNARRWGDKTPANVYHLPRIHAVFPNAAYLHMLRDGRDVVASYLDAGFYDSAEDASQRWLESVDLVREFGRRLPKNRYLEVRYESLVRNPEPVIRQVCRYLGTTYRQVMLQHRERVDDLGDTDASHHAGLYRSVDDRSVGTWRERLNADQRRVVEKQLRSRLSALGYLD